MLLPSEQEFGYVVVLEIQCLLPHLTFSRKVFIARSVVVDDISRLRAFEYGIVASQTLTFYRRKLFMTVTAR